MKTSTAVILALGALGAALMFSKGLPDSSGIGGGGGGGLEEIESPAEDLISTVTNIFNVTAPSGDSMAFMDPIADVVSTKKHLGTMPSGFLPDLIGSSGTNYSELSRLFSSVPAASEYIPSVFKPVSKKSNKSNITSGSLEGLGQTVGGGFFGKPHVRDTPKQPAGFGGTW